MSWRASVSASARQVRIYYDATSKSSAGLKAFAENNYQELKLLNPTTPFLIRLRAGAPTQLWLRDHNGNETVRALDGASEKDCEEALRDLVIQGTGSAESRRKQPCHYVVDAGQSSVSNPWMNEFYDDAEMERRVSHV